jgi:hypothetical protein
MAGEFVVTDSVEAESELTIKIFKGLKSLSMVSGDPHELDTDYFVRPPVTEEEQKTIIETRGGESTMGSLVGTAEIRQGLCMRFTEDDPPNQVCVDHGI